MADLLLFTAMFVVPFGGALVLAALLGRLTRRRLMGVPGWFKAIGAGLIAALWPFAYFIVWQTIDVALREARGDTSEYMGPALMLIYGFPITILTVIGCFLIAGFASVGRR